MVVEGESWEVFPVEAFVGYMLWVENFTQGKRGMNRATD